VAASSDGVLALLGRFAPRTRDIVLQTSVASDPQRLEFLLTLTPENQSHAARRLNMGWAWDDAVKLLPARPSEERRGPADGADEQVALPTESSGPANVSDAAEPEDALEDDAPELADRQAQRIRSEQPTHVVLMRLGELRPNPVNSTIYGASLENDRLFELADNLARYGQREPIIVDPSGMILSGERRWRALRLIRADHAKVIVDSTKRSAVELKDLILDDFSLKRKPSLEEQLNVYDAAVASYTRRYGRPVGRPKKSHKILSGFWDTNRIHDEAAATAGLGSRETVRQAKWVLEFADAGIRAAMLAREITIHAAYVLLREGHEDDEAAITHTSAPPQLNSGSSETSRAPAMHPDAPKGEPLGASAPTGVGVPRTEVPPSNGAVASSSRQASGSPPARDSDGPHNRAGEGPCQEGAVDAANHTQGGGAPGLDGPDPKPTPTEPRKARSATQRPRVPARRSFDRAISTAELYLSAVRPRDATEALAARDEAIARLIAAADGPKEKAATPDSVDGGAHGPDDTQGAIASPEVDLAARPQEGEASPTTIESEELIATSQQAVDSSAAHDDDVNDSDDEPDGTDEEDEAAGAEDQAKELIDTSQQDVDSSSAEDDAEGAEGEDFDYSDYFSDDDHVDDSDDEPDETDEEFVVDAEDAAENDEGDEESEESEVVDPFDAEIARLLGRSRQRRL